MSVAGRIMEVLRDLFTKDLLLKALALGSAVLFFSAVRGAEDAQRSIFVGVVALLPPPSSGRMLVADLPDQVRLTVRGSRSVVNSLRPDEIGPVQIDLREGGEQYYYFTDDQFGVPAGVSIVQVVPGSIPLRWADRIERSVPIAPQLTGSLSRGLVLGTTVEVEPTHVRLTGPREEVEPIRRAETTELDLSTLGVGDHDRWLPLMRPPPHTSYDVPGPVRVHVRVAAEIIERSFVGIEVVTDEGDPRSIRPARVEITVRGPRTEVEAMDPRGVEGAIDLPEDGAGIATLPVTGRGIPQGVEILRIAPAEVRVTF